MGRLFVILLILVFPQRGWSAQRTAIQMIPSPVAAATAGIQAMPADCPMMAQLGPRAPLIMMAMTLPCMHKKLLVCLALLWAMPAFSGPMGFKDSWMAMGDFSPNWQEVFVNYALTPRDAIGVSTLAMRSDDNTKSRQLADATYTRLVKRWNLPQAQANIWFMGGLGSVTGNDFAGTKAMASPGVQVDYETTRLYASATARLYRAEGMNHDFASARLGFSFYEVDYDETQPWLVVEVRRMNGLSDNTEVTPMLRLIHNRYFVELGVNNNAQGRINFMYIF